MRKVVVVALMLGVLLWAMTAGVAVAGPGKGKGAGQTKVALCHKGHKTITVGAPAMKAHLKHGDVAGECGATTTPEETTGEETTVEETTATP